MRKSWRGGSSCQDSAAGSTLHEPLHCSTPASLASLACLPLNSPLPSLRRVLPTCGCLESLVHASRSAGRMDAELLQPQEAVLFCEMLRKASILPLPPCEILGQPGPHLLYQTRLLLACRMRRIRWRHSQMAGLRRRRLSSWCVGTSGMWDGMFEPATAAVQPQTMGWRMAA